MIAALIARIAATVPELKYVGTAADVLRVGENNPTVTPCCYVMPMDESPGENMLSDMAVQQRVVSRVGVILVVRNMADNKGAAAGADMLELRQLVKRQVYGWQASAEFDPFARGSSHLLKLQDGHMWWHDIYTTAYYDRSN